VVEAMSFCGGVLQPANTNTIAAQAGAHLRTFKDMMIYLFSLSNMARRPHVVCLTWRVAGYARKKCAGPRRHEHPQEESGCNKPWVAVGAVRHAPGLADD